MKSFPPGYFTAPIYNGGTWPPGFKPTLYETWGHKAAQSSMAASENRDKRVADGCTHALGTVFMPGTPNTPAPKPTARKRLKGSVAAAIARLCSRPEGALTDDIAADLGLSKKHAGQRLAFFAGEQRRMGKTQIVQIPTGYRKERRYFLGKAAADAYTATQQKAAK
jgi:hypothetical protein